MTAGRAITGPVSLDAIVTASRELFARYGYYNTSMGDIANEVGILKGSLYHHVASKDEILGHILESTVGGLLEATRTVADAGLSPQDRFDAMVRVMLRNTAEIAREGTIIYVTEHNRLPRVIAEKYRPLLHEHRKLLEATVEDLVRERQDGADIDLPLAVTSIISLTTMMAVWYRGDGRLTLGEIEEQFVAQARRIVGICPVAEESAGTVGP